MEFKENTDVFDILKEMVRIQRKTMKDISLELDNIESMIKQMEIDKRSYNICGIRNQRSYELETMTKDEFKRMIRELVDSIYAYCGGNYGKKSDILNKCYERMDKEYSANLKQKRIEYVIQKGYAPYDNLDMISDFYGDYLIYKTVLLSMLEKMASDIWTMPEQTICLPSNESTNRSNKSKRTKTAKALKLYIPDNMECAKSWKEAQESIKTISDGKTDKVYNEIFNRMDKEYSIRWSEYRFRVRKSQGLTKLDKVSKIEIVDWSKKLQKQFVEQFNTFIKENMKVS